MSQKIPVFSSPAMMFSGSTDLGLVLATVGMSCGPQGAGAQAAPLLYNGVLYAAMQTGGSAVAPREIWVMFSTDSGVTWTVADQANSPESGTVVSPNMGGVVFDGSHSLIFAYNNVDPPPGSPIQLQNFDLDTQTWGVVYGVATAPTSSQVSAIYLRSDGSLIVFFNRAVIAGVVVGVTAAVFSGGVWGAAFNCDTNVAGGQTANADIASCYDPNSGTVHFFVPTLDGAFTHRTLYQQVLSDNSLGVFQTFTAADFGQLVFGENNPIIVGTRLLWGVPSVGNDYATLLSGTPLAAPTFTLMPSPGVDPQGPGGPASIQYAPCLVFDGATISGAYVVTTATGNRQVRVVQSAAPASPFTGWSGSLAFDKPDPLFLSGFEYPAIAVLAGRVVVTFGGPPPDSLGLSSTQFFMGALLAQNATVILRGFKRVSACNPAKVSEAPVVPGVKRAL
jgi:hypothetical protein